MAASELGALLARIVERLDAAGVHDESMAVWKRSRGLLGLGASDSLVPAGLAWRLGVLLLDRNGVLYSTGEVTRAVQPGRAAVNRSAAGEQRRAIRAVAARSNFPRGEVVNYGWARIALDQPSIAAGASLLSLRDGDVHVRIGDDPLGVVPLERYLDDRVGVLLGD